MDPRYREVWQRLQRGGAERSKALWSDPDYAAARARRMSEARGGHEIVACAVCGAPLEMPRWAAQSKKQHGCPGECRSELRRRRLAEHDLSAPAVRAKAGETRRLTLAARPDYGREVGARISQARRRRDAAVVEQLRPLPAVVWESLPEPDRSLVRRYYGLVGEQPATYPELIKEYHLTYRDIRRMITHGVARVLDPDAAIATVAHDERVRWRMSVAAALAALGPERLTGFSELERQLVVRYYGLDAQLRVSQRQIARDLGVDRKRVRAVLERAAALVAS
ncbi:MAG: hypothetical protein ACRDHX_03550 [Chloroflexota bacterium]